MKKLLLLVCMLAAFAFPRAATAQIFNQSYNFTYATTGGPTQSFLNSGVQSWFIVWHPVGPVTSCSVEIDSSANGASGWGSGDVISSQSCTSTGSAYSSGTLSNSYFRIHVTSLVGGSLNVTMQGFGGGSGGGSMSWPSGSAGVPNYGGSSAWGTTYNASNGIPLDFLSAPANTGDVLCGNSTPTWADCVPGMQNRTVSGTSDTILAADRSNVVTYTSSSSVAVSLPAASSFGSNFFFHTELQGSGAVTFTPASGTINGGSTLVPAEGMNCTIYSPDNTNYTADCSNGIISTWPSLLTVTYAPHGLALSSTAHNLGVPQQCADTSGSGTAQSCTTAPSFTPAKGDQIIYYTTTTNTNALTINVNASGAASVLKWQSSVLVSGDIQANIPVLLVFDGTNWQLQNIGNPPAGSTFTQIGASATTTSMTPSGTEFIPFFGSFAGMQSSDATAQNIAPRQSAMTVSNLQVRTSAAEGVSATLSFTLNMCSPTSGACTGATQALTCTIGNSSKTCSDTTHSVSVPSGEYIDFTTVQTGTGSSSFIYISYTIQ